MKILKVCLVAISFLTLVLQGCGLLVGAGAGAAAGVAGTKYAQGNLETTYPVGLQQAVKASQNAMQQSQIQITDTRMDSTQAEITGTRTSDGSPVTIKLIPLGSNSTKADIRVGKLGDENAARVLNRQIFEGLK
ncbi:MAG: DUF3568 family protein [Syntrophaceae bacterium]